MQWKIPKNTSKYYWTNHVTEKMHYYGLSEQKVLGVIRNPKRIETGIVENTVAVMIPVGNIQKANITKDKKPSKWGRNFSSEENNDDKWNQEIWVLYQIKNHESGIRNQDKAKKINDLKKALKNKEKIHDAKFMIHDSANRKICIISAWRYPGVSPKNNPIPEEVIREIEEIAFT